MSQEVKILEVKNTSKGNVKAFVTIALNGLTIRGCKVIQQANQRAWFALPQVESGGKYYPVVEAEPELKEAISKAVLGAWGGAL
jgi:DNA-binding cell septation regulator SpoVG